MAKQSRDCGRLKETEAFGPCLTEIASSVRAISRQSALLLQALSERAVLLADMSAQAEITDSATSQKTGKSGTAHGNNTSTLANGSDRTTAL
jgi:hypothetical protein